MDNDLGEGHRGQRNGCQFGPWVGGIWKPVPSGISSNLEACVSPASPCYRGLPTNASEQSQRSRRVMRPTDKRNLWPGLWRLMPEWREIVIQNNGVSKFFGSDAHMGRS